MKSFRVFRRALPGEVIWTVSPRSPLSASTVLRRISTSAAYQHPAPNANVSKSDSGRLVPPSAIYNRPDGLQLETPVEENRNVLPWFWLRDNCRCTSCVNQDTMQRNFKTFDIPADIKASEAIREETGVRVKWSDGHESFYPWGFINAYTTSGRRSNLVNSHERIYFGAEIASSPPQVYYQSVMGAKQGLADMTNKIIKYGFVFVTGTPFDDPEKTKELLERIAFIRETHYGGFYDFTPDLAMADTAYTNLALPAHTDTTYFTEPAGLQAFHLLSHTPAPGADKAAQAAEGGKSLLVDGFHAAKILQEEDPEAFNVLATKGVLWHASGNKDISITPYKLFPVIERYGKVLQRIRWNNDDRGVLPLERPSGWNNTAISATAWYDAARKWDEILRRKEMECWIQLKPGSVLIFDNWRVLHGRSAFEGIRRICGGYINRDDFISRWKHSNFNEQLVHNSVRG